MSTSQCTKRSCLVSVNSFTTASGATFDLFFRNPFPKRQILNSSKLKEFADDNFKFDENDRKFSERVVNTVGKGEIARYEQFLLFPQCFQKNLYCRHVKTRACLGKG